MLKWHTKLFVQMIASSSNGRTADSDSVNLGSNPGEAANKKTALERAVFLLAEKHLLARRRGCKCLLFKKTPPVWYRGCFFIKIPFLEQNFDVYACGVVIFDFVVICTAQIIVAEDAQSNVVFDKIVGFDLPVPFVGI